MRELPPELHEEELSEDQWRIAVRYHSEAQPAFRWKATVTQRLGSGNFARPKLANSPHGEEGPRIDFSASSHASAVASANAWIDRWETEHASFLERYEKAQALPKKLYR